MINEKGSLIISLDFELHWGAVEKWDIKDKEEYFLQTRKIIVRMLDIFEKYHIHATWATVGFLFASNLEELEECFPKEKPTYNNNDLNYYKLFEENKVGRNEEVDKLHFANSLIKEIVKRKGQELASHTFCHYYCNEIGQNVNQFFYDLESAQTISIKNFDIQLKSLVFPRNQFNRSYVDVVSDNSFKNIRVNPNVWFWNNQNKFSFIARAIDTLIPISKSLTFKTSSIKRSDKLILLPASRFFRPFSKKEKIFQKFKINRIKKEMTYAAKYKENYHIWWHPHNFGNNSEENMKQLEEILIHYKMLNKEYGFQTKNMSDFND